MKFPTHIVAAAGFVEDKDGNILLVKTHHRGWEFPGGQIDLGENLEEGVLREIFEESGIVATVRQLAGVYSNVGQNLGYDGVTHTPTKVLFDFVCDYVSGQPTISNETSEVKWIHKSEVLDYIMTPVYRYRTEKLLNFDGKVCYSSFVTRPEFKVLLDREV